MSGVRGARPFVIKALKVLGFGFQRFRVWHSNLCVGVLRGKRLTAGTLWPMQYTLGEIIVVTCCMFVNMIISS
jgi:hypothetical protein